MRHTYRAEQWVAFPVPRLFAFFANPANLPRLMPGWQKARIEEASIVAPPPPPQDTPPTIAAGAGTRMTITFRPFPYSPIRIPWDAEITEFAWNDHFCDIQRQRGPFAYWKHCHRLAASAQNGVAGTTITDHVEYELPFGLLGDLAQRLFVGRQMASTFAFRQTRLAEILRGSPLER